MRVAGVAQTPRNKPHTLALCGSCYCMTKRTRAGACGKCGAKKPPHPDSRVTDNGGSTGTTGGHTDEQAR